MIMSKEKGKFIHQIYQSKLNGLKKSLLSIQYDDYDGFIYQFVKDTRYLMTFCNERNYQKFVRNFNEDTNMFTEEE